MASAAASRRLERAQQRASQLSHRATSTFADADDEKLEAEHEKEVREE